MDSSDASALADLQMHWDEAYVIGLDGDIWSARYHTSADELRAHTSTELRELIRSDYTYRQKVDLATAHDDADAGPGPGDAATGEDEDEEQFADEDDEDAAAARRQQPDGVNFAAIRGERMST
jgi:hypothetical protein